MEIFLLILDSLKKYCTSWDHYAADACGVSCVDTHGVSHPQPFFAAASKERIHEDLKRVWNVRAGNAHPHKAPLPSFD